MKWFRVAVFGAMLVVGCASDAQQKAQDGAKALAACDMRTAHQDFSDAYSLDGNDPQIALAFALTDLALLAEDPALETLRPRFGFTAPFDTTFLWKKGGFMDLASQKTTTCGALGDLAQASIAHPSLAKTNPTPFLDTLDKTLTFGDLRDAGLALSPRLDKISKALETAAKGVGDEGVSLSGGCGTGTMTLQKPELLALAGALSLLHASFQLAATYDGSLRVHPLFMQIAGETGEETDLVTDLNAAFLHVKDASQMNAMVPIWQHAFDLFGQAIAAAQAVTKTPANAVIDWTSFPKPILVDAAQLATAAHDAFTASTPTAIPFLSPAVTVDGASLVSSPLELAPLTPAAWSLSGTDIAFTFDGMKAKLGARFTPDPFTSNASYSWSFVDDISNATDASPNWGSATFDPGKRFSSGFACQP
ncbi:MAG TPA: hypothetical protein VGH87_11335 [Polyangiaceae bacterium]